MPSKNPMISPRAEGLLARPPWQASPRLAPFPPKSGGAARSWPLAPGGGIPRRIACIPLMFPCRDNRALDPPVPNAWRALAALKFRPPNVTIKLWRGRKDLVGVLPDHGIAFTRNVLEGRTVEDLYVAAPVSNQARALQQTGRDRDGASGRRRGRQSSHTKFHCGRGLASSLSGKPARAGKFHRLI